VFEKATVSRIPSLCSKCRVLGHKRSSKTCPLRYSELIAGPTTTQVQSTSQSTLSRRQIQWIAVTAAEQPGVQSTTDLEQVQ
jgi:hypothetical protein